MEHLDFLHIRAYHLRRNDFTILFPIWMPFILCSCLIFPAKTSNTMLDRNDTSGHPCFVPDVRGKIGFHH